MKNSSSVKSRRSFSSPAKKNSSLRHRRLFVETSSRLRVDKFFAMCRWALKREIVNWGFLSVFQTSLHIGLTLLIQILPSHNCAPICRHSLILKFPFLRHCVHRTIAYGTQKTVLLFIYSRLNFIVMVNHTHFGDDDDSHFSSPSLPRSQLIWTAINLTIAEK